MTNTTNANAASAFTIAPGTVLNGVVRLEPPFRTWNCTLNHVTGGAFSYIAPNAVLHRTRIGRYCSIGNDVAILSHHPVDGLTSSPVMYQPLFGAPFESAAFPGFDNLADTVIGNDVWIGAGVQIKSGVNIGDGAVIGAGSLVTHDVAPYTVMGGVPARAIRPRFGEATVARLQAVAWWRYNIIGLPLHGKAPDEALDMLEAMAAANQLQPYQADFCRVWKEPQTGLIRARREPDEAGQP